jgi:hypothetical protein
MLVTIPIHKKRNLKIVKIPNMAQKRSFPPLCKDRAEKKSLKSLKKSFWT